jgi:hypothetical protein
LSLSWVDTELVTYHGVFVLMRHCPWICQEMPNCWYQSQNGHW